MQSAAAVKPRFETDGGVIVGTGDNFSELLADTEFNVVEFCA